MFDVIVCTFAVCVACRNLYLNWEIKHLSQELCELHQNKLRTWGPYIAGMEKEIKKMRQDLQKTRSELRLWQQAWKENQRELPKELLDCLKVKGDDN